MSLARCFGLVGYVIKKKTMMMSAMFVIVVLELIAQEQNRYDECNSSSWSDRLCNERKNHDDECDIRCHGFRAWNTKKEFGQQVVFIVLVLQVV